MLKFTLIYKKLHFMPSILVYLCAMNLILYNKEVNISEALIYPNYLTQKERYLVFWGTMFNDRFFRPLCLTISIIIFTLLCLTI